MFNSYTKAYNKRYERTGTLLEGRYKAIPVDKRGYLLHLCRYIHANPIRHGLASQLQEWPYSNYPEWMGLRDGALVDRTFVQAYFPTVQEYGQFVWEHALGKMNCRRSCSPICGRWKREAAEVTGTSEVPVTW